MTPEEARKTLDYKKVRFLSGGRLEQIHHCVDDPVFPESQENICVIGRRETSSEGMTIEIFLVREIETGINVEGIFLSHKKVAHVSHVWLNHNNEAVVELTTWVLYKADTPRKELICVPLE